MPIKANELPGLKGKLVIVQVTVHGDDDEDYREVSGRVLAAAVDSIAIQPPRGKLELIMAVDIIDIDLQPRSRRLVKRWIDAMSDDHVRQHLADRHGVPLDLLRPISDKDAAKMHNAKNHETLGHGHGVKPTRSERPRPED